MTKLPNAPLVEVIVELRWNITKEDLVNVQYLFGDIYTELKQDFPHRETITPVEIPIELLLNQPMYRFSRDKNQYPLYQVGPGIVTINTIAELYEWPEFAKQVNVITEKLFQLYPFKKGQKLNPSILYLDFFAFDFEHSNVIDFINKMFNVTYKQNFLHVSSYPSEINFGFGYAVENLGEVKVSFQKAKNPLEQDGILVQTRLIGKNLTAGLADTSQWLDRAHALCSDLFKKMTAGPLFDSFK
jgi:uncharacterized protein (TIGR04255 family)